VLAKELSVFLCFARECESAEADTAESELLKSSDIVAVRTDPSKLNPSLFNTPFNFINQVPEILGFAYTQSLCEIKMLHCGPNVEKFLRSVYFEKMTLFHRVCCCFDMVRQLLRPLQRLNRMGYTHGDLKPENICINLRDGKNDPLPIDEPVFGQPYVSKYEFRLIDFGIVTKFKAKKLPRRYSSFLGNLCFAAKRTLRHQ
jgi:serine/threonine protein kinase